MAFDGIAQVYGRSRPSYPAELLDLLFEQLPDRPKILEVGPGTGQATVSLLARGARVTAVELGPSMAAVLSANFASEADLNVLVGSFEDVAVADHSFDAVAVATAYHWITPTAQVARPIQLLRTGGVLAVIDLIQVDSPADAGYFARVQPIYDRYQGPAAPHTPKTHKSAQPAIATHLQASGRYPRVDVHRVPWDQTYTSAGYRDLLWSYSGTQMMVEPQRTAMVDELVAIIDDEFGGELTRPLVATLTLAWPESR